MAGKKYNESQHRKAMRLVEEEALKAPEEADATKLIMDELLESIS